MQTTLGWIMIIFGGSLYLAQLISSVSFSFAQRLGIQEKAETADPILLRSEQYTAYWDLLMLGCLPVAGILMITNHHLWPVISLIGGVIYLDAAGREGVKNLSFRHEGMRTGTVKEQRIFGGSYIIMALIAITVIVFSTLALPNLL